MSAVRVRGLTFGYSTTPVLRGVDMDVGRGELVAVIGRSGCGKTTLLRLLAGFERSGSGTIELDHVMVDGPRTRVPTHRRGVGVVPQEGALFPHLSVAANVGFAIGSRSPGRSDRITATAGLVGLTDLLDRYPRELSGGQQQRVALARALAGEPRVVLLDEPFASLDRATRVDARRQVRTALAAAGVSAVLVTHDREEALSMADRVVVMVDGTVVQTGRPDEVYDRPVSREAALLLGEACFLPVISGSAGSAEEVQTALGAVTIHAGTAPVDRAPGRLVVARPEQVRIAADGLSAVVESAEFLGPETRFTATLPDGNNVVGTARRERVRPGRRIRLRLVGPVAIVG